MSIRSLREFVKVRAETMRAFDVQAQEIFLEMIAMVPQRLLRSTPFESYFFQAVRRAWDSPPDTLSESGSISDVVLEFTAEEANAVNRDAEALRVAWSDFASVQFEQRSRRLMRHSAVTAAVTAHVPITVVRVTFK